MRDPSDIFPPAPVSLLNTPELLLMDELLKEEKEEEEAE